MTKQATITKRRCAGCSRVISGRSNKCYCSAGCKQAGFRRRQSVTKDGRKPLRIRGPVPSAIRGSNGVLIAKVARLGYVGFPEDVVLDVTYGRGLWWTRHRPKHLIKGEGDFRHRPEIDDSVPIICFDPPYISTGSRETSSVDDLYDRFGLGEVKGWRAIRQLIDDGLVECARILAPSGYLLVKCMDYVESGRKIWNTFYIAGRATQIGLTLVDRFHHLTGGGPQVTVNPDGSPRQQYHAREVTSMLLVFQK